MKNVLISLMVVMTIGVLIAAGLLVRIVMFPVDSTSRSIDMAYEVTDEILDGDNAIYNYEWFKQQEEDIEAMYRQEQRAIEAVEDFKEMHPNTEDWTRDQNNQYDRLQSNVTGLGNRLDDAIANYNARSNMASRNIFKDNLPSNISRAYFSGKELRN